MAGSPSPAAADADRRPAALAAAAVALAALAVYWTTLLPGLGFWDTAEAQTVLPVLGTMHPTGFPALVVTGFLFSVVARPLGEPAFLMNLLAAVCTALAAGGTVLVARRLRVPLPISAGAGIGIALTPLVWHISTAIDAHALHLLLVVALTLALLRWQALASAARDRPGDAARRRRADRAILLAAGVYGVAAANHGLALILAPSIILFVLAVEPRVLLRPGLVLAAIGTAAGAAAVLYLELPLRAGPFRAPLVYGHPETWQGFWDIVLARQFQGDVGGLLSGLPEKAASLAGLASTQFGPLAVLVPVGLLVAAARQPRYALFSGSAALVTTLFAASYANADITRYYLGPVFFAWTWLALLGGACADAILGGRHGEADAHPVVPTGVLRPAVSTTVAAALALALLVPTAIGLDARWQDADRSQDRTAQAWVDAAFGAMAPDAVVLSWWSYSTPMWYGELVEGRRPDVTIIDDSNLVWDQLGPLETVIDEYLGHRPVYLVRQSPADIAGLARRYAIQPGGGPDNLFLVTGTLGTAP